MEGSVIHLPSSIEAPIPIREENLQHASRIVGKLSLLLTNEIGFAIAIEVTQQQIGLVTVEGSIIGLPFFSELTLSIRREHFQHASRIAGKLSFLLANEIGFAITVKISPGIGCI